jgi:hypothetical protein
MPHPAQQFHGDQPWLTGRADRRHIATKPVAGGWVGQQVPDDDQDGAGDRDQGFELAAAPGDPPVPFAEEGAGADGCGGSFAENAVRRSFSAWLAGRA